ncbi:D-glycero-beta-D-manno-heptose 1-phosphate adenylyltransferase [Leptolyngbya sp. FACHB-261]|uniref:D-glycero-beta-D-manno-heptose 1-phosphate adenylyltransferase n=1 Tax=Leptolyngbya sp. FACHB-261 TaxID=2692806 RepID=UPI001685A754|nr:D-glycero-beta-D-manno-heptose 1-phosphate adenylyltransferase [Leptolyngbya sp. FACHB-261]MBD2103281.1 D-glycero-beta-D-manno-heptose 1-phosphate adenylyltransferase [Leptolyngbya sp. FACHB-261]
MIYTLEALQAAITAEPERWQPLVLTNGCFDLLHAGHVRYLQAARQLGQALVIGLNSDSSVQQLKGTSRPIVPDAQRAEVLAALGCVDAVVIFPQRTAATLVETLRPAIYAKGGDYTPATLPEAAIVQAYGGRVELIRVEVPSSTSRIIERIVSLYQPSAPA